MTDTTQALTQEEFGPADFEHAERIAAALGYKQTAYTSTSALWGLFCLPENPEYAKPGEATAGGCIIKTRELGLLFVQDGEDLHLGHEWADVMPADGSPAGRLEYLRGELRAERISYGELHELQDLGARGLIPADDLELREAAGLPEHPESD